MAVKFNSKRTGLISPTIPSETSLPLPSTRTQVPPDISGSSKLLASAISLSHNSYIAYAHFIPNASTTSAQIHLDFDLARRDLLRRNAHRSVLESVLPFVHLSKDDRSLWVFAFSESADGSETIMTQLKMLTFDNLTATTVAHFTYRDLYPCSLTCSTQRDPCPACLEPPTPPPPPPSPPPLYKDRSPSDAQPASGAQTPIPTPTASTHFSPSPLEASSAACLLPRHPLRMPYKFLLNAVRDRLIHDICEMPKGCGVCDAKRLRSGFLMAPATTGSEWNLGWEHYDESRPLVHCHLAVSLYPSHILATFHLRPTYFLPLLPSLPLPPGTPITLLPYSVPAYYLSVYRGPTGALTKQFETSLQGLGAGHWVLPQDLSSVAEYDEVSSNSDQDSRGTKMGPQFVIVWVSVQNKQGEDKGIVVIWPTQLCVSLLSTTTTSNDGMSSTSYAYGRQLLPYIPELPRPLQSSPVPAPATVPALSHTVSAQTPVSISVPTPGGASVSALSPVPTSPSSFPPPSTLPASKRPQLLRTSTSLTGDTLKAFRTLALSQSHSRDFRKVALFVGGYVDSVAKERERERERIRREREAAGQSPKLAHLIVSCVGPSSASSSVGTVAADGRGSSVNASAPGSNTPADAANESENGSSLEPLVTSVALPMIQQQQHLPDDDGKVMTTIIFTDTSISPSAPLDGSSDPAPAPIEIPRQGPLVTSAPFDPFGAMDGAWSQNADFIMDLGMDFNMNVTSVSGVDGGVRSDPMDMEMDAFGVFTDDDFSFFDGPTRSGPTPAAPSVPEHGLGSESGTGLTPAVGPAPLGMSPPLFADGLHMSGPGPLSTTPGQSHTSPWVSSSLVEGFGTPGFVGHDGQGGHIIAPELLPPSPAKTPPSHSDPVTPTVQFAMGAHGFELSQGSATFTPIPFAYSHRLADEKYVLGKFALPSPPDEEDRTESLASLGMTSWQRKYSSATDPRVAVIRKLIGVKRRISDQGSRGYKASPWSHEHEEWSSSSVTDFTEELDTKSDQGSDDDNPWIEEEDVPVASRPSTPPPSYLPVGPSLLATHFLHSELLPISSNLRPPGVAFEAADMASSAPISVPTPVSPAAVLGAASERTKSLEAAAQILTREVVENSLWAEAWRMSTVGQSLAWKHVDCIGQMDVQCAVRLIQSAESVDNLLDVSQILRIASTEHSGHMEELQADHVRPIILLEPPMLSIGKADTIAQILPPALRFWDKLGLGPCGGTKNVTAFVLFEEKHKDKQAEVEYWLQCLSATYVSKGFGTHSFGKSPACMEDGLVPLRFESFRKMLGTFMTGLPTISEPLLLYIITPSSILTLTSPTLRQVFSGIRQTWKNHGSKSIYFRFVPEDVVIGCGGHPLTRQAGFEPLIDSVYDRILRPADRSMSQTFFVGSERIYKGFETPAFSIARSLPGKMILVFQYPRPDLGVMDRHTLLHVGYQVSACGKWVMAACIDQRGQAHDLGVWLTQDDSNDTQVVSQVWAFAMQFTRQANIEWRIAFAKLGTMGEAELDAWMSQFSIEVSTGLAPSEMHVSVISVEPDSAWTFVYSLPHVYPDVSGHMPAHDRGGHGVFFADAASSTHTLSTVIQCPLMPACDKDLGTEYPYVPDDDDLAPKEEFCLRPLHTTSLIFVPATTDLTSIWVTHIHLLHTSKTPQSSLTRSDQETHQDITRNYHELAVLAQTRFKLKAHGNLPFHLAALQVMHAALERGEVEME